MTRPRWPLIPRIRQTTTEVITLAVNEGARIIQAPNTTIYVWRGKYYVEKKRGKGKNEE